jgi:hypothetical protein
LNSYGGIDFGSISILISSSSKSYDLEFSVTALVDESELLG